MNDNMKEGEEMDLEYFKNRLLEERRRLMSEVKSVEQESEDIVLSADGANDREDIAYIDTQNIADNSLRENLEKQLAEIDAALQRIADGTYGICEKTGKNIPIERLEANLSAKTIVEA
jgi:DnaK suppressor protein